MKKFLNEFKDFAMRGNVLDLAIGVVIGGAFSSIITSLVNDIITPFISLLGNSGNLETKQWVLRGASEGKEAIFVSWGNFIQTTINFLIIAFCIFMVVKVINKMAPKKKEDVIADPVKSDEAILLQEILAELKKDA